jgi:RNA polymerase sigma-70 factor (ECF subfamily)
MGEREEARVSEETPVADLLRRVRGGDEAAAVELLRRYEPALRRAVRLRLADAYLGALLDSVDICQSVLGSFFVRMAAGQYEIRTPGQLLQLLTHMACNKLVSRAPRERPACRDRRRVSGDSHDFSGAAAPPCDPGRAVAAQELLREPYRLLSPEERKLVDLRGQGLSGAAVATEVGGNAMLLRKRLSRALERVAQVLGLDEGTGER